MLIYFHLHFAHYSTRCSWCGARWAFVCCTVDDSFHVSSDARAFEFPTVICSYCGHRRKSENSSTRMRTAASPKSYASIWHTFVRLHMHIEVPLRSKKQIITSPYSPVPVVCACADASCVSFVCNLSQDSPEIVQGLVVYYLVADAPHSIAVVSAAQLLQDTRSHVLMDTSRLILAHRGTASMRGHVRGRGE